MNNKIKTICLNSLDLGNALGQGGLNSIPRLHIVSGDTLGAQDVGHVAAEVLSKQYSVLVIGTNCSFKNNNNDKPRIPDGRHYGACGCRPCTESDP